MRALLLIIALSVPFPSAPEPGPVPRPAPQANGEPPVRAYLGSRQLEALCRTPETDPGGPLDTCLGYLAGVVDEMLLMDAVSADHRLCPPRDFTVGSLRDDFLAYLEMDPEKRSMPAALVAGVVVASTFACEHVP